MENLSDKIKIVQIEVNAEKSAEQKTLLQKKLRKLLLQQQIENIKKEIESIDNSQYRHQSGHLIDSYTTKKIGLKMIDESLCDTLLSIIKEEIK